MSLKKKKLQIKKKKNIINVFLWYLRQIVFNFYNQINILIYIFLDSFKIFLKRFIRNQNIFDLVDIYLKLYNCIFACIGIF